MTLPSTGSWTVDWPHRHIASDFGRVEIAEGLPAPGRWEWQRRETAPAALSGHDGRIVADEYRCGDLLLRREVWLEAESPPRGAALAIRYRLTNASGDPLHLQAIVPLSCAGPQSLVLDGASAGDWEMLYQGAMMSYLPETLRLGTFDRDFDRVTRYSRRTDADRAADGQPATVHSEPLCLLRKAGTDDSLLLVGFLGQRDHLSEVDVRVDSDRRRLAGLTGIASFDGVLVPPGQARTSNWLLLLAGAEPNALLADFAERVGRLLDVPVPTGRPPAVYCSWQYYGTRFNEKELEENLRALDAQHVPCDVVQLDDGWMTEWGDWAATPDRWPHGMKYAAARIAATGRRAGIWVAPLVASSRSTVLKEHPEWLLRDRRGKPIIFKKRPERTMYALDPTAPGFVEHLRGVFAGLAAEGFSYFKIDYLRAAFVYKNARYHDPAMTRLQVYQLALDTIRAAVGPKAFVNVCNGHYGASFGAADSFRVGSDTGAHWSDSVTGNASQIFYRAWMNRLGWIDPDAVALWQETSAAPGDAPRPQPTFTDAELQTLLLREYLGGGSVLFAGPMHELAPGRIAACRRVIPALGIAAQPLDFFRPGPPSLLLTDVKPRCAELPGWKTVAAINWTDRPSNRSFQLDRRITGTLPARHYLAWEFMEQRVLGIYAPGATVELGELPPHASRLIKIIPWSGDAPVLVGTDLHFSSGGVEIASWNAQADRVSGTVSTAWQCPVRITAAFPDSSPAGYRLRSVDVLAGSAEFHIARNRP